MGADHTYIAIDLKSFYASAECRRLKLDPLTTNLVVADQTRTDKTICLAVSPSLKAYGIPGRPRLFEVIQAVQAINLRRKLNAPGRRFRDKSYHAPELQADPSLELDFVIAPPHMAHYMNVSAKIYDIYLNYVASEDIHVYSIDEVFIDVTAYLKRYGMDPKQMAEMLMSEVYERVGVRATAGVGPNMYLAKIAMDIIAKHAPDFIGVLDETAYKEQLWDHRPLSDFWRIGRQTQKKFERIGITTMGGIAELAAKDEDLLYRMFGIDAELLIDHAYGLEPTLISDIKGYKNKSHSLSHGQVLMRDYSNAEGLLIVKEMTEGLCHEMTAAGMVTQNVSIAVGYSNALKMPMSGGSVSFTVPTDAASLIMPAVADLYNSISAHEYPVRRIFVNFNDIKPKAADGQISIFDLADAGDEADGRTAGQIKKKNMSDPVSEMQAKMKRDSALQEAVNSIRNKYGKDAMFRGMDLEEAATARERNHQVGGHKE